MAIPVCSQCKKKTESNDNIECLFFFGRLNVRLSECSVLEACKNLLSATGPRVGWSHLTAWYKFSAIFATDLCNVISKSIHRLSRICPLYSDNNGDNGDVMLSTSQSYWNIIKFNLHDAVYLYLLTVNQTLAEGYTDYRHGRLIRNKTIGQRFVGKC